MSVLSESIVTVIGVDTHRDTVASAAVTTVGRVIAQPEVSVYEPGYRLVRQFPHWHAPGK
jgi:hypothetical protein